MTNTITDYKEFYKEIKESYTELNHQQIVNLMREIKEYRSEIPQYLSDVLWCVHRENGFTDPFTNLAIYYKTELEGLDYDHYYKYDKLGHDLSFDFELVEWADFDQPTFYDFFIWKH